MRYLTEFRYKVPHYHIKDSGWVKVGENHSSQVFALRYCYDLAGRDQSVIDYRVVDGSGRIIFQKNCFTRNVEGA